MIGPYLRLVRIEHAFLLSFATYVGLLSLGYGGDAINLAMALAVPFFIEMGAFALNDYYDVEADKINRRLDRPLASGELGRKSALVIAATSFLVGNALAFLLGQGPFLIAAVMTVLSWIYNARLKDLPAVGNMFIAITMAMPFVYASALAGESSRVNDLLALSAFFMGFGREVVKDIEDMEGDAKARKSKTLPLVVGKGWARAIAMLSFAVFFVASTALLLEFAQKPFSILLFVISLGLVSYGLGFLLKDFKLDAVRKITLAAMGVGLLAAFIGLL